MLLTGSVGPVPEVLVAYISSVLPVQSLPSDLLVDPAAPAFEGTHLKVQSTIRLHKLATIHGSSLVRHLGALPSAQHAIVVEKLRVLLGLVAEADVARRSQ